MELRHLRYFVAVAEALNFSRAAERLHVTQPALSRQIRDLEDDLGSPLFLREKGRVSLTDTGRRFLDDAREILARSDRAVKCVRHHESMIPLRVAYLPSAGASNLPEVIRSFRKSHPSADVGLAELPPAAQFTELNAGRIDLALPGNLYAPLPTGLSSRVIATHHLAVAVPAGDPRSRRRKLRLAELADADFLSLDERHYPGRDALLDRLGREAGFAPRVVQRAESLTALLTHVGAGAGLALVPDHLGILPKCGFTLVPLAEPRVEVPSHAVWKTAQATPVLTAFVDALAR